MKIMLTLITAKVVECRSIAYLAALLLEMNANCLNCSHQLEMHLQHEVFP